MAHDDNRQISLENLTFEVPANPEITWTSKGLSITKDSADEMWVVCAIKENGILLNKETWELILANHLTENTIKSEAFEIKIGDYTFRHFWALNGGDNILELIYFVTCSNEDVREYYQIASKEIIEDGKAEVVTDIMSFGVAGCISQSVRINENNGGDSHKNNLEGYSEEDNNLQPPKIIKTPTEKTKEEKKLKKRTTFFRCMNKAARHWIRIYEVSMLLLALFYFTYAAGLTLDAEGANRILSYFVTIFLFTTATITSVLLPEKDIEYQGTAIIGYFTGIIVGILIFTIAMLSTSLISLTGFAGTWIVFAALQLFSWLISNHD